jgi:hypothetical protein
MNIEKYDKLLKTVKQRIRNLKEKKDVAIFYSAYFIKEKSKDCILNRIPVEKLILVRKNLIIENPDIVRFELFDSEKETKCIWMYNIDLRTEEKVVPQEIASFKGLGEAEINQIVESKLSDRQRIVDFDNIKKALEISNSEYLKLEQRLQETEDELQLITEESQARIEELENLVEVKSGIKYYAGVIGDLLEGFGIAKDKIRKPMAALMGFDEEQEMKNPKSLADKSGIVEDDEVTDEATIRLEKRKEIIDLISQYLHNVPDDILSQIFSIFSEIEGNTHIAIELLNHAKSLNSK